MTTRRPPPWRRRAGVTSMEYAVIGAALVAAAAIAADSVADTVGTLFATVLAVLF